MKLQLTERLKANSVITRGQKLGEGCFGIVYEGTDTRTGKKVAIKELKDVDPDRFDTVYWMRELQILSSLDHETCLKLISFSLPELKTDERGQPTGKFKKLPTIVMPLMRKETLEDAIQGRICEWNATKKSIAIFGIATGMAYIHSKGFIHRDLKPNSILLNDNLEPVIGSFSIARNNALRITVVGTPLYMLETDFDYEGSATVIDIYSYGVLLYSMFADKDIWKWYLDDDKPMWRDFRKRLHKGHRFRRVQTIPDSIWSIITNCWRQPKDRPSFGELVDYMIGHNEWIFPGTNEMELLEYETRVIKGIEDPYIERWDSPGVKICYPLYKRLFPK